LTAMAQRVAAMEAELSQSREAEEMTRRMLLVAQRTSEEAVAEAEQKARGLVDDAERRVAALDEETRRRRASLESDIEALRRLEGDVRTHLRQSLEAHLALLQRTGRSAEEAPAVGASQIAGAPMGAGLGPGGQALPSARPGVPSTPGLARPPVAPPGAVPPGAPRPGTVPPGAVPPGAPRPGTAPPGAAPPGAPRPAAAPPGPPAQPGQSPQPGHPAPGQGAPPPVRTPPVRVADNEVLRRLVEGGRPEDGPGR
jgi:hypothetical protein